MEGYRARQSVRDAQVLRERMLAIKKFGIKQTSAPEERTPVTWSTAPVDPEALSEHAKDIAAIRDLTAPETWTHTSARRAGKATQQALRLTEALAMPELSQQARIEAAKEWCAARRDRTFTVSDTGAVTLHASDRTAGTLTDVQAVADAQETPEGYIDPERLSEYAQHLAAIRAATAERLPSADAATVREYTRMGHDHPRPKPLLIGAGGLKAAGKDALSDYLVAKHGFVKLGMSDTLAKALYALNPLIPEVSFPERSMRYRDHVDAVGYTQAKEHEEVRSLLQRLGTDVGRDLISQTIWTDISRRLIAEHLSAGRSVIITGMRFQNELAMIDELGGHTIWVNRPVKASAAQNVLTAVDGALKPSVTAQHVSETTLKAQDFHRVVLNAGTLADLYRTAEKLIPTLAGGKPTTYNSTKTDAPSWSTYDH